MEKIKRVAIVGLGAMGAGYAWQIANENKNVELYGVVRNYQKYMEQPVQVNGQRLPIVYTVFEKISQPIDLIIIAVKTYNLQDVINRMAPAVGENTVILSVLNGLTSEEKLIQAFGEEHVLYATVIGADANRADNKVTSNKCGCLYFGEKRNEQLSQRVQVVREFLEESGLEYQIPENMEYKLWEKFLVNIGCNQVSTVYQMNYEQLRTSEEAMDTMRRAQREVIALANWFGVELSEKNIESWEADLKGLTPKGRSSMLQDFWQGRPLEMDILGDTVIELGKKAGIAVPVNQKLRDQIYLMVQERAVLNQKLTATPEKIAAQLRLDILLQKIKKGDKMAENQLAARFSASRSSVRTALHILSNEGLIITHPNGRREAVEFTRKQVMELYDFRCLLEEEALRLVLSQKNTMYPMIAQVLEKIERVSFLESGNVDWYDLDVQFHRAMIRSSGNMFIINAWESNAQLIYALMSFNTTAGYGEEYAATFFEKHRLLYELLLSDDEKCYQELKKHIMDAGDISNVVLDSIGIKG